MSQSSTRRPGERADVPSSGAGLGDGRRPLVRALRPKQWLKNVLVAAAPLAAGTLLVWTTFEHVAITFVSFCLVSSAGYLVNDVLDAEADRKHPTKRNRPVASGALRARTALLVAGPISAAGLAIGFFLVSPRVGLVLLVYLASTFGYSLAIKHQPVFDLAVVSAGFVLRAIAGGIAAQVPLTQWFLLVASFGSLFVVAGKRYAEVPQPAHPANEQSTSVVQYSASYLRFVWGLAASAAIAGYSLWAFDVGTARGHSSLWAEVSVAPFVLAVLRYAAVVDRGEAGCPEDVVLSDHGLQVVVLVWLVTFGIAANVV